MNSIPQWTRFSLSLKIREEVLGPIKAKLDLFVNDEIRHHIWDSIENKRNYSIWKIAYTKINQLRSNSNI